MEFAHTRGPSLDPSFQKGPAVALGWWSPRGTCRGKLSATLHHRTYAPPFERYQITSAVALPQLSTKSIASFPPANLERASGRATLTTQTRSRIARLENTSYSAVRKHGAFLRLEDNWRQDIGGVE